MMLDLHIEGAAPVTLLVRDESRSTRSTSMNRDEDECELEHKKASSLALQIVDSETEPLTLAEEMASFEYIDELASEAASSFSDFDAWSPKEETGPQIIQVKECHTQVSIIGANWA